MRTKAEYLLKGISQSRWNPEFQMRIICYFRIFSLELIEKFKNLNQYIVVRETYEWWEIRGSKEPQKGLW